MPKTYRFASSALRDVLLAHIRAAQGKPVSLVELNRLAKSQGFPATAVRNALHPLTESGEVRYTANPTAFEVMVVEVQQ